MYWWMWFITMKEYEIMAFAKITCPICKDKTVMFTSGNKDGSGTVLFTHENGKECIESNEVVNEGQSNS
jgi:hypothetical protein